MFQSESAPDTFILFELPSEVVNATEDDLLEVEYIVEGIMLHTLETED